MPPLLTLAVALWGIRDASYWRDEAATVSAVRRPLPGLLRMLTNVDAVHGSYYLLMWPMARLFGTGELVMRLPSALAMSGTALLIVAIGRWTLPRPGGLMAGLAWALLPATSWYGQDARSYAFATTLACGASYLFIRALHTGKGWGWYTVSLAGLGLVNLFALLLIPAHGITVVRTARGHSGKACRRWLVAASQAALVTSPLMVLGWRERADIGWIPPLDHHEVTTVEGWAGSPAVSQLTALIIVIGIAFAAAGGPVLLRERFPAGFAALCVPWVITPLAILFVISLVKPVFEFRYILISMPAMALLIGAALGALGKIGGFAALAVLALTAIPGQVAVRGPAGHYENIRWLDQIIAAREQPHDAVLYSWPGWRQAAAAYPYGLARLNDIALAKSPEKADNLLGTELPDRVVISKLRAVQRVWLVEMNPSQPDPLLTGHTFRLVQTWHVADVWLWLYERGPAPEHN